MSASPRQPWAMGLLALLPILAIVVAAAALVTQLDRTGGAPRWVAEPLAPPSLRDAR